MTVTPMSPRPNTSVMSGVIATSGTERSTIAIGMTVCSTERRRLNTIEHDERGDRARREPDERVLQRRERVRVEMPTARQALRRGRGRARGEEAPDVERASCRRSGRCGTRSRNSCQKPSTTASETTSDEQAPAVAKRAAAASRRTGATGGIATVASMQLGASSRPGPSRRPRREEPADERGDAVRDAREQRTPTIARPHVRGISSPVCAATIATPRPRSAPK